jgi:nucleoside-diphosphate-sugar epimerase
MLENKKILITGPTSQVAFPVARALAESNEVYGLARLSKAADRKKLEDVGVTPCPADLLTDNFENLPPGIDYVLNFAVIKTPDFATDLAANAEGAGRLMAACAGVKAFLHCSSTAVYEPDGHRAFKESDPLGDNHRVIFPTYSISKIAAETVVRFAAAQWNIPTVIARLNVPYGNNGGWPLFHLEMILAGAEIDLHEDKPNMYNPIHEDDYTRMIPKLLKVADVPAVTVNWGGSTSVSIEQWCEYMGKLVGVEPKFKYGQATIASVKIDTTKMHELVGPTEVDWKDGFRRLVETSHPEIELRT